MDIFGLPLHPLVVHAAVILVPLAAMGALLVVAFPKLRDRYGRLTALVAAGAAVSALAARFTGPEFAEELGLAESPKIARHIAFGWWLPWPVVVLAIALALFLWWSGPRGSKGLRVLGGVSTVAAALVSLVLVGITGHAGAAAVWLP